MNRILSAFFLIMTAFAFSSCAPLGKKDLSPLAPARTSAELSADTRALNDQIEALKKADLTFTMQVSNGVRSIGWKNGAADGSITLESVQITELDRFVEIAQKYLDKYTAYSTDGKAQGLSDDKRGEISAEIILAKEKLNELKGIPEAN